jgi:hypothetical protein
MIPVLKSVVSPVTSLNPVAKVDSVPLCWLTNVGVTVPLPEPVAVTVWVGPLRVTDGVPVEEGVPEAVPDGVPEVEGVPDEEGVPDAVPEGVPDDDGVPDAVPDGVPDPEGVRVDDPVWDCDADPVADGEPVSDGVGVTQATVGRAMMSAL